ncbi:MAG TPA: hypothetical protein VFM97_00235 [Gammaproteobacteria bacterium]|nr:hypothetical protein [Gammaproteobacteria bacterium]
MIQRPPFYINRPRREALDPVTHANLGLRGHVEWQVREADGTITQRGERDNMILDQGLNMLPDRWIADCFTACCVGTGNSAPAAGQTGLDLEIARTNTYITDPGACGSTLVDPVTWQMKRTFSFPVGALDSSRDGNYKEIGVSYTNTPGQNLFARTLFSSADAPAELAITSTQSLWVVYTLTITCAPAAVTAGSINITGLGDLPYTHAIQDLRYCSGLAHDSLYWAIRGYTQGGIGFLAVNNCADADQYGGYAGKTSLSTTGDQYGGGPVGVLEPHRDSGYSFSINDSALSIDSPGTYSDTAAPANNFAADPVYDAYVAGNFYQDRHFVLAANQANFNLSRIHFGRSYTRTGTLNGLPFYFSFAYVLRFDNPIVKADTHTFEMVFRLSWGRA